MGNYAKWLGGSLGWVVGGPIGGLLGFVVGSMFDSTKVQPSTRTSRGVRTTLFIRQFGQESAKQALRMLKDLLKQEIPVRDVCLQIGRNMDYSSRLQLLHLLFNISLSDSKIHPKEIEIVERISEYMRVTSTDFLSIKNMFVPETDSLYKILEIESTASDEELKTAFRRMAKKYHPDKVSHLGDDFRKTAGEKFRKVNDAYEKIKKERSLI